MTSFLQLLDTNVITKILNNPGYCLIAQQGLQFNLDMRRVRVEPAETDFLCQNLKYLILSLIGEVYLHNFFAEYVNEKSKTKRLSLKMAAKKDEKKT